MVWCEANKIWVDTQKLGLERIDFDDFMRSHQINAEVRQCSDVARDL